MAGTLPETPRWSLAPSCLRSPCGPSVSMMDGTPATGLVVQKSCPLVSWACCSTVRSAAFGVLSDTRTTVACGMVRGSGWVPVDHRIRDTIAARGRVLQWAACLDESPIVISPRSVSGHIEEIVGDYGWHCSAPVPTR